MLTLAQDRPLRRDWYLTARLRNRGLCAAWQAGYVARHWCGGSWQNRADWQSLALPQLIALARCHGVPAHTKISLANLPNSVGALAGFKDAPQSFQQPFIVLDQATVRSVVPDVRHEVASGLLIHEASHLLWTRMADARPPQGLDEAIFRNLWEDERIETLARSHAPGYAGLLEAARQALIVKELLAKPTFWEELSDRQRLDFLPFVFIRAPEQVTPEMQCWKTVDGSPVFELFRAIATEPVLTEEDQALDWATRTFELWNRLCELYPAASPAEDSKPRSSEAAEPRAALKTLLAAAEKQAGSQTTREEPNAATAGKDTLRHMEEILDFLRRLADGEPPCATSMKQPDAPRTAEPESPPTADEQEKRGSRSGTAIRAPLIRTSRRGRALLSELSTSESFDFLLTELESEKSLASAEDSGSCSPAQPELEEPKVTEHWSWGGIQRKTIVATPRTSTKAKAAIARARKQVGKQAMALRRVMRLQRSSDCRPAADQRSGKLTPGRLHRHLFDDRLFTRGTMESPQPRVALALLVDQSGSMFRGQAPERRIDRAMEVATLMADAVRWEEGVEFQLYAHCSAGDKNQDVLVKRCMRSRKDELARVASFSSGIENYDSKAIETAAGLFRQETKAKRKIFLVLSDGAPEGYKYEGKQAVQATRDVVSRVRASGIAIAGIAIQDFHNEDIYGPAWTLKYTNPGELVDDFRRLLVRLLR